MNKVIKTASAAAVAIAPLVSAAGVFAQDYSSSSDDAAGLFAGTLGIFIFCCAGLLGIISIGLTIWMSIDAMQRDEKVLPGKVKWLLAIILTFLLTGLPIGAVLYYFMRKTKLDSK